MGIQSRDAVGHRAGRIGTGMIPPVAVAMGEVAAVGNEEEGGEGVVVVTMENHPIAAVHGLIMRVIKVLVAVVTGAEAGAEEEEEVEAEAKANMMVLAVDSGLLVLSNSHSPLSTSGGFAQVKMSIAAVGCGTTSPASLSFNTLLLSSKAAVVPHLNYCIWKK